MASSSRSWMLMQMEQLVSFLSQCEGSDHGLTVVNRLRLFLCRQLKLDLIVYKSSRFPSEIGSCS